MKPEFDSDHLALSSSEAKVILLNGVRRSFAARFERGVTIEAQLTADRPLMPGTTLRIECGDSMYLGEVMSCRQGDVSASEMTRRPMYTSSVRLEHSLQNLKELHNLMAALMDAGDRSRLEICEETPVSAKS